MITEDGYDKHIHCDGSREHVLSYSIQGIHCSHKNCVVNRDNQSNVSEWIFIGPHNKPIQTQADIDFKKALKRIFGLSAEKGAEGHD